MKRVRLLYALMLALTVAAAFASQSATVSLGDEYVYYAKIDYFLTTGYSTSLLLDEAKINDVQAPPPPPGYSLYYLRVSFPGGLPKEVIPVKYSKSEILEGKVIALVSYSGVVTLAASSSNVTVDTYVSICYVKSGWLKLQEGEVRFAVEDPPPPFTRNDLTVKITIDNHAPFAIVNVKDPNSESLFANEKTPAALKVDYKHLELNLTFLETGEYTICLAKDRDYELPPSFLVAETDFREDVVKAGETKKIGIGQKSGWRSLGAVVILYSIAPLTGRTNGEVDVSGTLVDYAYYKDDTVTIRAASFLIPNINLRVWIKAYIVFGTWFEVRNNMRDNVNLMYTTIFIKDAGVWTPKGVEFTIKDADIKDAAFAYLVVQAPSYATITSIRTPSGIEVGGRFEGLLPWGNEYRDIRTYSNEAYVQVKAFDSIETGNYIFEIDWKPINFKLIDDCGETIIGAKVDVRGPLNLSSLSDSDGVATFKLYKPGNYLIDVQFKGVTVATLALGSIVNPNITVKCDVYRASWLVVDAWDKPIQGAEVIVKNGGTVIARTVTGEEGGTEVIQIPKGKFIIESSYKRIVSTRLEEVNNSGPRKLKLDVLFEIPILGGIPLTTLETAVMSVAIGGGTAGLKLLRKGKAQSIEEISLEE
ncbi:MAG: hypothetical protein QXY49_04500 [Thermofilaceae archaeon]